MLNIHSDGKNFFASQGGLYSLMRIFDLHIGDISKKKKLGAPIKNSGIRKQLQK